MSRREKDPDTLNTIRKFLGLPPVKESKKKCLRCNMKFDSVGAHNRLCDKCRRMEE